MPEYRPIFDRGRFGEEKFARRAGLKPLRDASRKQVEVDNHACFLGSDASKTLWRHPTKCEQANLKQEEFI
jgi:hypothetical protein